MIIVTSDDVAGRRISESLGLVRGSAVRARPFFSDIMAYLRLLVGGEIPEYTKVLGETREQCLDRMISEAEGLGADAIVATRFVSAEVLSAAAEFLVYGTAVKLEDQ